MRIAMQSRQQKDVRIANVFVPRKYTPIENILKTLQSFRIATTVHPRMRKTKKLFG
jgi:hypothetical protein